MDRISLVVNCLVIEVIVTIELLSDAALLCYNFIIGYRAALCSTDGWHR